MKETSTNSQQAKAAPAPGGSGTICSKTGLYKASDGRIEFVIMVEAGKPYPAFPGGSAAASTAWSKVGTTDSSRQGFEAIAAPDGSVQ